MFQPAATLIDPPKEDDKLMYKYKSFLNSQALSDKTTSNSLIHIDELLETEKKTMNSESWNKLDKRLKIQKLHAYAEKYGKENSLPMKEIKSLKMFFSGLCFNNTSRAFTLRNLEKKVSTLKSLTPKRDNDENE